MLYAYIIYPYSFNLNPYKNLYDDFIISNIIYEPLVSFLFYN